MYPPTPPLPVAGNMTVANATPTVPGAPPVQPGEAGVIPLSVGVAVTLAGILVLTLYNAMGGRRAGALASQVAGLGASMVESGVEATVLSFILFQSTIWTGFFNFVYAQLASLTGAKPVAVTGFYDLILMSTQRIVESWGAVTTLLAGAVAAYVASSVAESVEVCAVGLCAKPLAFAGILKSISGVVAWASLVDLVLVKPIAILVLVALGYLYYPLLAIAIVLWALVFTQRYGRRLLAFLVLVPVALAVPLMLTDVLDAALKAYLAGITVTAPPPTGNPVLDAVQSLIAPLIAFFYKTVNEFLAKLGVGLAELAVNMFFEVAALIAVAAAWDASGRV